MDQPAAPGRGLPAGVRARERGWLRDRAEPVRREGGHRRAPGQPPRRLPADPGAGPVRRRSGPPSCGGRRCGGLSPGTAEMPAVRAGDLEPGPLTLDAVADWVRDRPERGPVLTRLLSVLEDPAGKRVVIVAAEADEAMTLDRRGDPAAAGTAGARRLVQGVQRGSAPRRAAHRRRAGRTLPAARAGPRQPGVRPGRRRRAAATTPRAASAPPSSLASWPADERPLRRGRRRRAGRRSSAARRRRPGGADAMLTAWALTRPDESARPSRPRCSAGSRGQAGTAQGARSGGGRFDAGLRPARGRAALDRRRRRRQTAGPRPGDVRVQLLAPSSPTPRPRTRRPRRRSRPAPLSDQARRDAESKLSSAILLGSGDDASSRPGAAAGPPARDRVWSWRRPLQRRLHEFAVNWIDHPAGVGPRRLGAARPESSTARYDELHARFAEPACGRRWRALGGSDGTSWIASTTWLTRSTATSRRR